MEPSDAVGFIILLIIYGWVAGSIAVTVAANKRKKDGGAWFFYSLLLSPPFALLMLIAMPMGQPDNPPSNVETLREVLDKAHITNSEPSSTVAQDAEQSGPPKPSQPIPMAFKVFWSAAILFCLLVAIVAIVAYRY